MPLISRIAIFIYLLLHGAQDSRLEVNNTNMAGTRKIIGIVQGICQPVTAYSSRVGSGAILQRVIFNEIVLMTLEGLTNFRPDRVLGKKEKTNINRMTNTTTIMRELLKVPIFVVVKVFL